MLTHLANVHTSQHLENLAPSKAKAFTLLIDQLVYLIPPEDSDAYIEYAALLLKFISSLKSKVYTSLSKPHWPQKVAEYSSPSNLRP